jgi:hypothetical protein
MPAKMRVAAAGLALVVLAVSLALPLEPARTVERARRLAGTFTGERSLPRDAASFWFDPDYTAFLADVKAGTPETATVAVLVPERLDIYFYQALYQLAPRRVVQAKWLEEADYVATYRTDTARGPGGRAITHGLLWAR